MNKYENSGLVGQLPELSPLQVIFGTTTALGVATCLGLLGAALIMFARQNQTVAGITLVYSAMTAVFIADHEYIAASVYVAMLSIGIVGAVALYCAVLSAKEHQPGNGRALMTTAKSLGHLLVAALMATFLNQLLFDAYRWMTLDASGTWLWTLDFFLIVALAVAWLLIGMQKSVRKLGNWVKFRNDEFAPTPAPRNRTSGRDTALLVAPIVTPRQ